MSGPRSERCHAWVTVPGPCTNGVRGGRRLGAPPTPLPAGGASAAGTAVPGVGTPRGRRKAAGIDRARSGPNRAWGRPGARRGEPGRAERARHLRAAEPGPSASRAELGRAVPSRARRCWEAHPAPLRPAGRGHDRQHPAAARPAEEADGQQAPRRVSAPRGRLLGCLHPPRLLLHPFLPAAFIPPALILLLPAAFILPPRPQPVLGVWVGGRRAPV